MSSPVPARTTQLDGVRGGRIAADESMRVPIDMQSLMGADRRSFGIVDARIESQRRGLAGFGDFNGAVRADIPRVRQIQDPGGVRAISAASARPAQASSAVNRAMLQALATVARTASGREIRRAGRALALSEVDCDAHAAIALVLQGLHLAQSHPDRKAGILADGGLGLRSAASTCILEGALDNRLEIRLGEAHWVVRHCHTSPTMAFGESGAMILPARVIAWGI